MVLDFRISKWQGSHTVSAWGCRAGRRPLRVGRAPVARAPRSQRHLGSAEERGEQCAERELCPESQPRSRNPGYTDCAPESYKAEK